VTGEFSVLPQLGTQELTAIGGIDAYIASIIPKP
jgi:hypothetical protein